MKKILLQIITILHIMFILFVLITPFTNSNYFILMHSIVVPFVMLHWVVNNNLCVLTVIERFLRKSIYKEVNDDDCVMCRLIEPVYDFKKNNERFTVLIYVVSISLWLIAIGKIISKYHFGEVKKIQDLFQI